MGMLDDVITLEEDEDATREEEREALQRMISSGAGWSLQGSYGRAMADAIEAGECVLGPSGVRDYWGNYVPSRDEVKPGTKGSILYANRIRRERGDRIITQKWLARVERSGLLRG